MCAVETSGNELLEELCAPNEWADFEPSSAVHYSTIGGCEVPNSLITINLGGGSTQVWCLLSVWLSSCWLRSSRLTFWGEGKALRCWEGSFAS